MPTLRELAKIGAGKAFRFSSSIALPLLWLVLSYAALPGISSTLLEGEQAALRQNYTRRRDLVEVDTKAEYQKFQAGHASDVTFVEDPDKAEARAKQFHAAVTHAASSTAAGRQIVFMTVAESWDARFCLPLFVASLRSIGGLDAHLVVATLDEAAQAICSRVHNPKLCFEEGIPAFVNNFDIHSTFHEGRISGAQPTFIGWVKTIVGLRIHQLGYQMMLLDSDAVFFSNPLPHLDPAAHISASLDCDPSYHPKHNRIAHTANLGLSYFDSSPHSSQVLSHWMSLASPYMWDQGAFKEAMEAKVLEDAELEIQMLSRDTFVSFCCEKHCQDIQARISQLKSEWQLSCPVEKTQAWVHHHSACTGESHSYRKDNDYMLEKRHLMQSVWEMVMWHRNESLLTYNLVR